MNDMQGLCNGNFLQQQRSATIGIHVRAVVYVSRWVLLSNLVVVTWIVAMRGARLKAGIPDRQPATAPGRSRRSVDDIRLVLVATLIGSAAIHAGVIHEHLAEWTAAGVFFTFLTAAEIAARVAVLLRRPRGREVLLAVAAISVLPLVLWLYSRSTGLPFGPEAGEPEAIGVPDVVACLLEVGSLLTAGLLLHPPGWVERRPPASAHIRGLGLLALTAISLIGLAGIGPSWFDFLAIRGGRSAMMMSP